MISYEQLNEDQTGGIDQLYGWIKTGIKVMGLAGAAGTGKSTTVRFLLERLRGEYSVLLLAPTHASRGVLSDMTLVEDEEGQLVSYDVSTTHSGLGLRPDVNIDEYDPDKPEFSQQAEPLTKQYDIVLQEEASMINPHLMQYLIESCNIIIFMGDECQLPPVGFNDCVALQLEHKVTLSKVMRQKGDSTLKNTLSLMRCIISQKNDLEYEDNSVELLERLHLKGMPTSCYNLIADVINSEFNDGTIVRDMSIDKDILDWEANDGQRDNYLLLAFTRKKVASLNDLCAMLLEIKPFRENFRVIITKTFRSGKLSGLTNNSRGRIVKLGDNIIEYHVGRSIIRCIEIEFLVGKERYKFLTPLTGSLLDYISIHKDIMQRCIDLKKWDELEELQGDLQILKDCKDDETSRALEAKMYYVDTRKRPNQYIVPGYAVTIHKTQGSTIPNVIVAIEDTRISRDLTDRLLYVALSRASQKVYII